MTDCLRLLMDKTICDIITVHNVTFDKFYDIAIPTATGQ